jgi:vacuolar-type H+-ATPase subunit F/Vma7
MSRAVVVGERSHILGFKGAGFEIVPVEDGAQCQRGLLALSKEDDISLVLVTESMAMDAGHAVDDFRRQGTAILVVVPTHEGSKRTGFLEMKKAVERSIGVDILGKD